MVYKRQSQKLKIISKALGFGTEFDNVYFHGAFSLSVDILQISLKGFDWQLKLGPDLS